MTLRSRPREGMRPADLFRAAPDLLEEGRQFLGRLEDAVPVAPPTWVSETKTSTALSGSGSRICLRCSSHRRELW
jgi:hypothetical protein